MIRSIVLATGLLSAASAFAQSTSAGAAGAPGASADVQVAAATPADLEMDRHCLRETGTHIHLRGDRAHRRCASYSAGRVYTREDIERTGQVDISDALRMLDPSVY